MTSAALSTQALNRALLARQRLLARTPLPADTDRDAHVLRLMEHLAGLRAQAPFPPYYGLCLLAVLPPRAFDVRLDPMTAVERDSPGMGEVVGSSRQCNGWRTGARSRAPFTGGEI